jgi:hypothetical protein
MDPNHVAKVCELRDAPLPEVTLQPELPAAIGEEYAAVRTDFSKMLENRRIAKEALPQDLTALHTAFSYLRLVAAKERIYQIMELGNTEIELRTRFDSCLHKHYAALKNLGAQLQAQRAEELNRAKEAAIQAGFSADVAETHPAVKAIDAQIAAVDAAVNKLWNGMESPNYVNEHRKLAVGAALAVDIRELFASEGLLPAARWCYRNGAALKAVISANER